MKRAISMRAVRSNWTFLIAAAALSGILAGLTGQQAFAVGGTLDQSLCESDLGGAWTPDTCTITSTVTINSGETLRIPSGIALVATINDVNTLGIQNDGTINNLGYLYAVSS